MKYRAQRFPTRYPVKLIVGPVGYKSLIISISASGVCFTVDQTLAVGQDVALGCLVGQIRGKVKWSSGDKIGVMFNQPIARADLERIRHGLTSNVNAKRAKIGSSDVR